MFLEPIYDSVLSVLPIGINKQKDIQYGYRFGSDIIRASVPDHQDNNVGCPACGADLHYSNGWERRVCTLCEYIEGAHDYRTYPMPYNLSEYMYVLGYTYQMMKASLLDTMDGADIIEGITTYGSPYRPINESED